MSTPRKKPERTARENVLRIRLTEAERQVIDEFARSQSLETSTWARSVLLTVAKQKARQ